MGQQQVRLRSKLLVNDACLISNDCINIKFSYCNRKVTMLVLNGHETFCLALRENQERRCMNSKDLRKCPRWSSIELNLSMTK